MAENKAVLVEEVTLPTGCCFNSSLCLYEEAPKFKKKSCDIFRFCWFIFPSRFWKSDKFSPKNGARWFPHKTACNLNGVSVAIWSLLPSTFIISSLSICDFLPPGPRSLPPDITSVLHSFFSTDNPPIHAHTHTHTPSTLFQMYVFLSLSFFTLQSLSTLPNSLSFIWIFFNCSPAFPHTVEGERRVEVVG